MRVEQDGDQQGGTAFAQAMTAWSTNPAPTRRTLAPAAASLWTPARVGRIPNGLVTRCAGWLAPSPRRSPQEAAVHDS